MNLIQIKNRKTALVQKVIYAVLFSMLVIFTPSCKKDTADKSHLSVRMTDAPASYNAVLIDIQGVEVTGNGGTTVLLNTNAGIYNLLDFTNGMDTLLATGDLDAGSVSQIRLILGANNSVVINNVSYPLSTPSALQSGLKLQVHQTFEAGVSYSILLDFDATQSIVTKGNGEYQLKPVIRTIDAAFTGSIRGSITPVGTFAVVTATSGTISYSTVTNPFGQFLIAGLAAGTYNITVTPILPLLPVIITGATVTTGVSTNIGIITF